MKNTTNINNSIYEFDISLINTKRGSEIRLPLPKGAIEYLEIDNSLSDFGIVGKCRISNFYGILEQLNVLDVTSINCMYVSIRNTDFNGLKSTAEADIVLSFLAILSKCADTSTNVIDKSVSFTFEEYYTARTRMESINDAYIKAYGTQGTPGNLIYNLFTFSNKESTSKSKVEQQFIGISKPLFDFEGETPYKLKLTDFYNGDTVKSVYDLIQECYKYLSYIGLGPGIISINNILEEGVMKRKITLQPIANYISGFYEKYNNGVKDLREYVTEEFVIGDAASSNALNTNFIDQFNFLRVDQADLLSNKWIDYNITDHISNDLTKTLSNIVYYTDVRFDFSKQLLNGANANLPDRNKDASGVVEKISTKTIHKKVSDSDSILTRIYVENALKKSFIFDNTAITFTVQGNTYRKAGKFIKIRSKDINKQINNNKTNVIDGYWFIIGIKHIFKGDYYTNEYTCVKLHSDGRALQGIQSTDQQSNINPFYNILNPQGDVLDSADPSLPLPNTEVYNIPQFNDGVISNTGAGGAPGVLPNRTTSFIDTYNDRPDPISNPFPATKIVIPKVTYSENINGNINTLPTGNTGDQQAAWDKIQQLAK